MKMASKASVLIRHDFESFVRKCFRSTHSEVLGRQPYVQLLCTKISEVDRGETSRLIINLPPRHLKSFVCTVCLAAWRLAQAPDSKILLIAYGEELARNLARGVQEIIRLPWYQEAFLTRIARSHASVMDFATTQGGAVRASSVGGSVTGFGCDLLIFDDPLNILDANNEVEIARINDIFYPSLMSRLNHPRTSPVVVVAHRLHENDLTSYLMEEGGWDHLVLPFVAPEDTVYGSWHRRAGELLRPGAYSDRDIARIMSGASFATLYQQCIGSTTAVLVPEDFGHFSVQDLPQRIGVVLSVDASQCKGPRNSWSVIQAWYRSGDLFLLLDQWRDRCNYADLWLAFRKLYGKYRPAVALIERAANGFQLIRDARARYRILSLEEIVPDQRSKEMRLAAQASIIKAGRIRLPHNAGFVVDYVGEFTAKRREAFDQIDATVQYLAWAADKPYVRPAPSRAIGEIGKVPSWAKPTAYGPNSGR